MSTRQLACYLPYSAWERQAELCNRYLSKGQRVLVVGEIREPRIYTDREGNTRASLDVRARNVRFLSTREEGQPLSPGPDQGEEEDVPF